MKCYFKTISHHMFITDVDCSNDMTCDTAMTFCELIQPGGHTVYHPLSFVWHGEVKNGLKVLMQEDDITPLMLEIKRLRDALETTKALLENCSVGGVGKDGMTLPEMEKCWEEGKTAFDNAEYDLCQHMWNLIDTALAGKD